MYTIIISFLISQIIIELILIYNFGWLLNSKKMEAFTNNIGLHHYEIIDKDFLFYTDHPYIAAHLDISFLSKYYIEDIGRVPVWSKLSKDIDKYIKNNIKKE